MLHDECSRPPCGFFPGILDRLIGKLSLCRYLQLIYFVNQNMQTYIYTVTLCIISENRMALSLLIHQSALSVTVFKGALLFYL